MNLFRPRHGDGERLDVGGLPVRLKVEPRARRLSLRIDRARREAVAIAPSARRLGEALRFAGRHRDWIAARLAALPTATPLHPARPLLVFGEPWRLSPDGRRPRLIPGHGGSTALLTGCGAGEVDGQLVARALKAHALPIFCDRLAAHCHALGVEPPRLSLSNARTRWGSCTPAGQGRAASIRLSWRLALAPFAVADYVAAHECAHLLEANHGPRFWAYVRELVGDPGPHRAWLRTEGQRLHALVM